MTGGGNTSNATYPVDTSPVVSQQNFHSRMQSQVASELPNLFGFFTSARTSALLLRDDPIFGYLSMPVFQWGSAFDAFRELEQEMDRWVRSMDMAIEGLRLGKPFPALNLYELDAEYLITAELPGTQAEDLEISINGGVLVLRGSRTNGADTPADRFRRSERVQGKWERQISLPERVRDDEIHAELANGILKLHLPKSPSSQPKQIRVVDGEMRRMTDQFSGGES